MAIDVTSSVSAGRGRQSSTLNILPAFFQFVCPFTLRSIFLHKILSVPNSQKLYFPNFQKRQVLAPVSQALSLSDRCFIGRISTASDRHLALFFSEEEYCWLPGLGRSRRLEPSNCSRVSHLHSGGAPPAPCSCTGNTQHSHPCCSLWEAIKQKKS